MLGWLVLHTQTNSISYLLNKDTTTDKTATYYIRDPVMHADVLLTRASVHGDLAAFN